MEKKKYLTIKEYADIRGVSVSSVYKRLNTTLKDYCVTVENKKMLKCEVLSAEGLNPVEQKKEEDSNEFIQPLQPTSSTFFEKQLEAKDKQIDILTEQIKVLQESNKKKDDFIQEQSKKLTELLEQSNILLQNNQLLLANKPEKNNENKEEIVVDQSDNIKSDISDNNTNVSETNEKKSWFRKLFR